MPTAGARTAALLVAATLGFADFRALESASGTGTIQGTTRDSLGAGIADVHISIPGIAVLAISDAEGAFRLASVPAGSQTLIARRIGFHPETLSVRVAAGRITAIRIRLDATPQKIAPVVVSATRSSYVGRLRDFYQRRDRGVGRFFTAEEIAQRRPRLVTDLIRTIPGVRVVNRAGVGVVSFREMACAPLVWVDGTPATTSYLSPDMFTPSSLAGIEVYSGPATVPPELMGSQGQGRCGVIALWTDVPEARRQPPARTVSAQDLSLMIASLYLYTADQVDVPAVPREDSPISPVYPAPLLRDSIPGRVVAEFVVDADGVPDMESFAAIVSSDHRFTESVRHAITRSRFIPARRAGQRVKQLMQMPFVFRVTAGEPPPIS